MKCAVVVGALAEGDEAAAGGRTGDAIAKLVAWLTGVGIATRRGIDDSGNRAGRPALVGAYRTVVGLAGWAVGLYNA